MATVTTKGRGVSYPTSDGRPMAETDLHRDLMVDGIERLKHWFADEPRVYVSGNMLIYYVPGNKRKHVAPDIFVVRGVVKQRRDYYLVWEEGKSPDAVIELTSKTTRKEDTDKKFQIYRDILRVPEYFLCDPRREYLKPPLQGFRLEGQDYRPIQPVEGRLPSEVLGLHLELAGEGLRFFDPTTRQHVLDRLEQSQFKLTQAEARLEQERQDIQAERQHLELARQRFEQATRQAEEFVRRNEQLPAEVADLRRQVEELKHRLPPNPQ